MRLCESLPRVESVESIVRLLTGSDNSQTKFFMTWVKICGTTNLEDALVAVEAGADAVGFVFYENSPRKITVKAAREIVEKLPESVEKVGVFVAESPDGVDAIGRQVGLTAVQVYSPATQEWLDWQRETGRKLVIAIQGTGLAESVFRGDGMKALHAILLDSGSGARPGGTGERFDWESVKGMVRGLGKSVPVIVAGGLTPENVGEAIGILKPWGVDVASGVEARPGKKDLVKVRAFVKAVRAPDKAE
jgi:phosphoribosylanthranilate isomerase